MTLDTRAARLEGIRMDLRNKKGLFDADAEWLLDALDAAESRYAQLSALVDTWQRRFNLELQRALAAESLLAEYEEWISEACNALGCTDVFGIKDAGTRLRETREALERAEELLREWLAPHDYDGSTDEVPHFPYLATRAFLARLPTEEE